MYCKEITTISSFAFVLFIAIDAGNCFLVNLTHRQSNLLVTHTVSGLSLVSQGIERMQTNWRETCRLPDISAENERQETIRKISENSTAGIWDSYKQKPKVVEEASVFDDLVQIRHEFLVLREQYFQLLDTQPQGQNRSDLAKMFLLEKLLPAYESYCVRAFELLRINLNSSLELSQDIGHEMLFAQYLTVCSIISTLILCGYVGFQLNIGAFAARDAFQKHHISQKQNE